MHIEVHSPSVAIFHRRMRGEAQLVLQARALAQQLSFRIIGGDVRVIAARRGLQVTPFVRIVVLGFRKIIGAEAFELTPGFN